MALSVPLGLFAGCSREAQYYAEGSKRFEGSVQRSLGAVDAAWSPVEDGEWTYWFPNGERRESGRYENGRRTGLWTQWYPHGQRRSQGARAWNGEARAALREGPWTFWYASGEIESRGVYRAGQREGQWEFTHDDGGLDGDKTGQYHDDRRIDG